MILGKTIFAVVVCAVSLASLHCSASNPQTAADITGNGANAPHLGPIFVDRISLPHPPVVNEVIPVTYTISSLEDVPDTTVYVAWSHDSDAVGVAKETITSQVNLIANQPVTFTTEIAIKETGLIMVWVYAKHKASGTDIWGDQKTILLTVGTDTSSFGWPNSQIVGSIDSKTGKPKQPVDNFPPDSSLPPPPVLNPPGRGH
ncbi:MAG: hypothetical protein PHO26_00080 [Dehalococcoidia bacterium]|nr:hypothetical protein [Dehalococcoidia bacterium]MDD5493833.1 hypothetical protein [Dehalococcoidia bacterium]